MLLIIPLMNRICRSIETGFSVAFYSFMAPRSVYYFFLGTSRFVSHDGMVSARIIIT